MSWGTRRRNTIIFIFFLIVLIPLIIIAWSIYYKPPDCFDGIQNGAERGVDCGGTCALLCQSSIIYPIVVWKKEFPVAPGVYNVIAYVENPNPDAGVKDARYLFKLYDKENILLYERKGQTSLRPREILPIVENTLFTDKLEATRVSFEFIDEELVFEKMETYNPVLVVKDEIIKETESSPKVEAVLQNTDILPVNKVRVVVILYDAKNNAIASSSTFVERIGKDESVPIVFTWPVPFSAEVSRIEIIPIYDN